MTEMELAKRFTEWICGRRGHRPHHYRFGGLYEIKTTCWCGRENGTIELPKTVACGGTD